jgi:hypothetical protein
MDFHTFSSDQQSYFRNDALTKVTEVYSTLDATLYTHEHMLSILLDDGDGNGSGGIGVTSTGATTTAVTFSFSSCSISEADTLRVGALIYATPILVDSVPPGSRLGRRREVTSFFSTGANVFILTPSPTTAATAPLTGAPTVVSSVNVTTAAPTSSSVPVTGESSTLVVTAGLGTAVLLVCLIPVAFVARRRRRKVVRLLRPADLQPGQNTAFIKGGRNNDFGLESYAWDDFALQGEHNASLPGATIPHAHALIKIDGADAPLGVHARGTPHVDVQWADDSSVGQHRSSDGDDDQDNSSLNNTSFHDARSISECDLSDRSDDHDGRDDDMVDIDGDDGVLYELALALDHANNGDSLPFQEFDDRRMHTTFDFDENDDDVTVRGGASDGVYGDGDAAVERNRLAVRNQSFDADGENNEDEDADDDEMTVIGLADELDGLALALTQTNGDSMSFAEWDQHVYEPALSDGDGKVVIGSPDDDNDDDGGLAFALAHRTNGPCASSVAWDQEVYQPAAVGDDDKVAIGSVGDYGDEDDDLAFVLAHHTHRSSGASFAEWVEHVYVPTVAAAAATDVTAHDGLLRGSDLRKLFDVDVDDSDETSAYESADDDHELVMARPTSLPSRSATTYG